MVALGHFWQTEDEFPRLFNRRNGKGGIWGGGGVVFEVSDFSR